MPFWPVIVVVSKAERPTMSAWSSFAFSAKSSKGTSTPRPKPGSRWQRAWSQPGLADFVDVAFHCVEDNFAECLACRAHLVDCGLQNCGFAREDPVWKKHLTPLELFPDRAQS
jgi:hypothetical protein